MWKRATSFRQFYNNLKRSFTSGNIENQIRNLDPIQATNWTEWCASQRFLFYEKSWSFSEISFIRVSIRVACRKSSLRYGFLFAIFQRIPRRSPPSHLHAQSFLLFSPCAEIGRFSRTSILDASFMHESPRCPLQIRLFLARPFDSIFQFLHALAKTRTPIVSLPTDFVWKFWKVETLGRNLQQDYWNLNFWKMERNHGARGWDGNGILFVSVTFVRNGDVG